MNNRGLYIIGRILIPSVYVGLGLERLLDKRRSTEL